MPRFRSLTLALLAMTTLAAADPHPLGLPAPPASAIGFPSRAADLDAWPGFVTPPPGYGTVSFYWWVGGEPLTRERLRWQMERMTGMGIMGLQINYAHDDVGGSQWGLTMPSDPPLFSPAWWDLVTWFADEAQRRGMAISLSDYTLGGPGQGQWMDELLREHPDLHPRVLACARHEVTGGQFLFLELPEDTVGVSAWRTDGDSHGESAAPMDLRPLMSNGRLRWTAPPGRWQVAVMTATVRTTAVNPTDPRLGPGVLRTFFQRFEDRLPGRSGTGLNFFFSDELDFGVLCGNDKSKLWDPRISEEFRTRKGYDLTPELPGLFTDLGPRTAKLRLDYHDILSELQEEAYFRPLTTWHQERGMIFGCDHGSRGNDPVEFGDYARTQRWMSGIGNDQPKLGTDVTRTKVHSSLAHLYRQPRVWLEGYYASGWGTTPTDLVRAGVGNYALGSTLQTLHGLYYTTHGGWWEWAPPCNHFRMPYWKHMGPLMVWQQRMCYLLSQGVHRCDVAVLYPTAEAQTAAPANLRDDRAMTATRALLDALHHHGIDSDLVDDQSLARATVVDGTLQVEGERYRVLVLPPQRTLRQADLDQARRFAAAGGLVVALGDLPEATEAAGRTPAVAEQVRDLLTSGARHLTGADLPAQVVRLLSSGVIPRDAVTPRPGIHVLHRVIGPRDVFLVVGAHRGEEVVLRARGTVEVWDAWTGTRTPLPGAVPGTDGTLRVRLPTDGALGTLLVVTPGDPAVTVTDTDLQEVVAATRDGTAPTVVGYGPAGPRTATVLMDGKTQVLRGEAPPAPAPVRLEGPWEFHVVPTCDNRFGDYRLPASPGCLGPEVRRLRWQRAQDATAAWQDPALDDRTWDVATVGAGPAFLSLGPVEPGADLDRLLMDLAGRRALDPTQPVRVAGQDLTWRRHDLSWREGIPGDPGHQGWHGLKGLVSDDFLGLGKPGLQRMGTPFKAKVPTYVAEGPGGYALWTTLHQTQARTVRIVTGDPAPARLLVDGKPVNGPTVTLPAGTSTLVAWYDRPGRTHLVVQDTEAPSAPAARTRTPLAMRWFDEPGLVRPDPVAPAGGADWFRFQGPPALEALDLAARAAPQVWVDGQACLVAPAPGTALDGTPRWHVTVPKPVAGPAQVAVRVPVVPGRAGGAALPEPIGLTTGTGTLAEGDWARIDGLSAYSGAAVYARTVTLTEAQRTGRMILDLGDVAASARVTVNGRVVGTLLAPPWTVDVTAALQTGPNRLGVEVCNTLANHYQTIPTEYRGDPRSGLIGPVRLVHEVPVTLRAP